MQIAMFSTRKSEPAGPASPTEQSNGASALTQSGNLLSRGVSIIGSVKFRDQLVIDGEERIILKESDIFGIVEGRVVELRDVEAIASLPSKEELISKVLFLINCQAQRLVTVLSAVPRNLAIVIKQIGDQKSGEAA